MSLRANTLPASAGFRWVFEAWYVFKRQPIQLMCVAVFGMLLTMLMVLIPLMSLFFLMLIPGFTLMGIAASRTVAQGLPLVPYSVFGIWREPLVTRALLKLGLLHMIVLMLFAILVLSFYAKELEPLYQSMMQTTQTRGAKMAPLSEAQLDQLKPAVYFSMLAYVVTVPMFWFSPMLVAWHRIAVGQAVFFSILACWRNKWAFIMFALIAAAAVSGKTLLFKFLQTGLGVSPMALSWLDSPLILVFLSLSYCVGYVSYVAVITDQVDTAGS